MTQQELVTGIAVAPDGKVTDVTALNSGIGVRGMACELLDQATPRVVIGWVLAHPVMFLMDPTAQSPNGAATCLLTDAVAGIRPDSAVTGTVVIFGLEKGSTTRFVNLHTDVVNRAHLLADPHMNVI